MQCIPSFKPFPTTGWVPFKKAGYYLYRTSPFVKSRGENLSIEALWKKLQAEEPRSHQYQQGQGQEKTVEVTLFCRYCRAA